MAYSEYFWPNLCKYNIFFYKHALHLALPNTALESFRRHETGRVSLRLRCGLYLVSETKSLNTTRHIITQHNTNYFALVVQVSYWHLPCSFYKGCVFFPGVYQMFSKTEWMRNHRPRFHILWNGKVVLKPIMTFFAIYTIYAVFNIYIFY